MAGKNGSIKGSWQGQEVSAPQNPPDGSPVMSAMTAEQAGDLLARLQDILALWPGSDNKIIGSYVMAALPVNGLSIGKMDDGHGKKVFCVNGVPVTAVMAESEKK